MKKVYKYIACAFALSAALSCSKLNETPVFEDSESFAAFGQTSYSVKEDAGTISIPVTIASTDAKQVTVAYSVADGTAKKGTNYTLADEAAVLVYDGKTRTQNIVINITNIVTTAEKSGYTGELVFTVTLENAGNLKLGHNKSCTEKIVDLDHPLAAILGQYKVVGSYYGGTAAEWTLTMDKDETDPTVVWIDKPGYFAVAAESWGDFSVYGNVSEDLKTITIPCGQTCGVNSDSPAWDADKDDLFLIGTWAPGIELIDSGVITLTQQADGTWKIEEPVALFSMSVSSLYAQMLMDAGSMVLTKL